MGILALALTVVGRSTGAAIPPVSAPTALSAESPRIVLQDGLYLRPIGEGVFVIVHAFPWPSNSLLVTMRDGTLVFAGTPCTADAMKTVLAWARREFGARRMVAIDTGYHCDNLGGNRALIDAGVPVYGSDLTARLLATRGEWIRQVTLRLVGSPDSPFYKAHAALSFVPPDHVFPIDEGLRLTFGGEDVQVYYPGPSQAPEKVVVYFPSRRLMFGSCMILAGERAGNTADADLARWPEAIRHLARFPVDTVVPGHGDRIDAALLQHTLDVLASR